METSHNLLFCILHSFISTCLSASALFICSCLGSCFIPMKKNSAGEWEWWFRVCSSVAGTQDVSFVSHLIADCFSFNCKMITVIPKVQIFKRILVLENTNQVPKLPWQCKSLIQLEINSGGNRIFPIFVVIKRLYLHPLCHHFTSHAEVSICGKLALFTSLLLKQWYLFSDSIPNNGSCTFAVWNFTM